MDKSARLRELREGRYLQQEVIEKPEPAQGKGKKPGGAKAAKDLDQWYLERRKELSGWCQCGCGQKSSKHDDNNYKGSICHILPKRFFKSVAMHPLNYIELAMFGGCHTNFDERGSDLWPNMECWPVIRMRFLVIFPAISPKEYKHLPPVLLKILEEENIKY